MLIEQGADKEKVGSHGYTPLHEASRSGYLEVTQYLVEQGSALDKGNDWGWTPLMSAVVSGHLEICRYLLEQGADRDKADDNGRTSLHFAANNGHLETAMLLMSYGANLNARSNIGQLPIDNTYTKEIKQAIRDEPRRRMDEAPSSEPPSKTDIPTQPHPFPHSRGK